MLTLRTADLGTLLVCYAIRTLTLLEKVPPRVTLIRHRPEAPRSGYGTFTRVVLALEEAMTSLVAEIESLGLSLRELPQDIHRNYASGKGLDWGF